MRTTRLQRRSPRPPLLALAGAATAIALATAAPAFAQTGGGYELTWNTIDGGGATFSTGGGFTLGGTIGQPDAGLLTGGSFTLRGGFWGGGPVATGVPEPGDRPGNDQPALPLVQRLYPNVPNPFNPRTAIAFDLPHPSSVRLEIFNLRGELVRTLVREDRAPGHHTVIWEGNDDGGRAVASGSYILRLSTQEGVHREKVILVR